MALYEAANEPEPPGLRLAPRAGPLQKNQSRSHSLIPQTGICLEGGCYGDGMLNWTSGADAIMRDVLVWLKPESNVFCLTDVIP